MKKIDTFGSELTLGTNLETFAKLKNYFREVSGVNIVKYYKSLAPASTLRGNLKKQDLKRCAICDMKLYHTEPLIGDYRGGIDKDEVRVTQKRHLVALSAGAESIYTCYGLSRCFRRIKFSCAPLRSSVEDVCKNEIYLKDIIDTIHTDSEQDREFWEKVSGDFDIIVAPFLNKWMFKKVHNENVLEFISSLRRIEIWLDNFEPKGGDALMRKIYKLIGVMP